MSEGTLCANCKQYENHPNHFNGGDWMGKHPFVAAAPDPDLIAALRRSMGVPPPVPASAVGEGTTCACDHRGCCNAPAPPDAHDRAAWLSMAAEVAKLRSRVETLEKAATNYLLAFDYRYYDPQIDSRAEMESAIAGCERRLRELRAALEEVKNG